MIDYVKLVANLSYNDKKNARRQTIQDRLCEKKCVKSQQGERVSGDHIFAKQFPCIYTIWDEVHVHWTLVMLSVFNVRTHPKNFKIILYENQTNKCTEEKLTFEHCEENNLKSIYN